MHTFPHVPDAAHIPAPAVMRYTPEELQELYGCIIDTLLRELHEYLELPPSIIETEAVALMTDAYNLARRLAESGVQP